MDELKNLSKNALDALIEKYEYTSRIFPDSDSFLSLAEVYLALGEITRARRIVSDFTEKKGDSSRARFILAKAHLMCCKTADAEQELQEALRLDPRNKEASDLLVSTYKKMDKTSKAFRVSLSFFSGLPPDTEVADTNNTQEPPPEPEEKSKPEAGTFETNTMLNLYFSQGLYEDALGVVEVLCELEPDNPVYRAKREKIMALLTK